MTTEYEGRDAILKTSANGGSTFTVVGGARTSNVTINNAPVDVTNVSSGGWRKLLAGAGTKSVDMSVDGVVSDDSAFQALQTQANDNTSVYMKIDYAGSGSIVGTFVVNNLVLNNSHDNAQMFTCSIQSSGPVTWTPDS